MILSAQGFTTPFPLTQPLRRLKLSNYPPSSKLNRDVSHNPTRCSRPLFTADDSSNPQKASSNQKKALQDMQLDKELETFFESANEQGARKISFLTSEERAQRTIKGIELEDAIYGCRDQLLDLQSEYLSGSKTVTIEEIKALSETLQGLKNEYIVLVGATDVPLYFGRIPDQLQ